MKEAKAMAIGCVQHDCPECKATAARVNGQPHAIYVEWVDSAYMNCWCSPGEIELARASGCVTIGFLVKEDDTNITLALNKDNDPNTGRPYGHLISIPKIAITLRASVTAFYLPSPLQGKENG